MGAFEVGLLKLDFNKQVLDQTPRRDKISTIKIIEKSRNIFKDASPEQFNELGYKISVLDSEQNSAKASVDIALMDLVTKKLGVLLYKYLGLDKSKTPITSFSIGIDKPEVMKEKVKEASIYPLLKIKDGRLC